MADKTYTDVETFVKLMLFKECDSPDTTLIQSLANLAIGEINDEIKGVYTTWSGDALTIANGVITMPSDMLDVESVWWDGAPVKHMQTEQLDAEYGNWRESSGISPVYFARKERSIILFPIPTGDVSNLKIYGTGCIPEFPAGADPNPLTYFPESSQMGICDFILANYPADMSNRTEEARVQRYSTTWPMKRFAMISAILTRKHQPFTY
jgi:hypothetical protein